jgi:4-carboxymuconolactone decarboxylase
VERLPRLRREDLTGPAVELWEALVGSRGAGTVGPDGALIGPFNAWLNAPEVGLGLSRLGATLRFGTSIDRRLTEVAIITVGARWQAEFEWWAHARMAREQGVADEVIEAIARGQEPVSARPDELVVHSVARQLVTEGRLEPDTFQAAEKLLGGQGMVELVSLCGYYCLVSFILNAFAVPLPEGVTPLWG